MKNVRVPYYGIFRDFDCTSEYENLTLSTGILHFIYVTILIPEYELDKRKRWFAFLWLIHFFFWWSWMHLRKSGKCSMIVLLVFIGLWIKLSSKPFCSLTNHHLIYTLSKCCNTESKGAVCIYDTSLCNPIVKSRLDTAVLSLDLSKYF